MVAGSVLKCPALFPRSSFVLQEEYARRLESKLVNLLEPAAGIGNVRASVQAKITNQNITKKRYNPITLTETKIRESGPVLVKQSVSVLINNKSKNKLSSYQNLVETAIGYDAKRGDRLSVEVLPFVAIPLWSFGLTPVTLVRIGGVLLLLILAGCFWLFKEGCKTFHSNETPNLSEADREILRQEAELEIRSFLKKLESSVLDDLLKWADKDIQDLLHYVSKRDLVRALQMTSVAVQNVFERNIHPALWQDLLRQARTKQCSFAESRQAQEKIMRAANLLKEARNALY